VNQWQRKHPRGKVVCRNVAATPISFVTEQWIAAAYTPVENRTADEKQVLPVSDTLIDELEAADAVVLAEPMHNFSISAQLKTWIDQVVGIGRAGDDWSPAYLVGGMPR
jgi:FMN-dependent NADH-azoreductase